MHLYTFPSCVCVERRKGSASPITCHTLVGGVFLFLSFLSRLFAIPKFLSPDSSPNHSPLAPAYTESLYTTIVITRPIRPPVFQQQSLTEHLFSYHTYAGTIAQKVLAILKITDLPPSAANILNSASPRNSHNLSTRLSAVLPSPTTASFISAFALISVEENKSQNASQNSLCRRSGGTRICYCPWAARCQRRRYAQSTIMPNDI